MGRIYVKGGITHPQAWTKLPETAPGSGMGIIGVRRLATMGWARTAQEHRDHILARIKLFRASGRPQWDRLLAWRLETILAGYKVDRTARYFSLDARGLTYLDKQHGVTYRPHNSHFFLPMRKVAPHREWALGL